MKRKFKPLRKDSDAYEWFKPTKEGMRDSKSRKCHLCFRLLKVGYPLKFCPICWDSVKWNYAEKRGLI